VGNISAMMLLGSREGRKLRGGREASNMWCCSTPAAWETGEKGFMYLSFAIREQRRRLAWGGLRERKEGSTIAMPAKKEVISLKQKERIENI